MKQVIDPAPKCKEIIMLNKEYKGSSIKKSQPDGDFCKNCGISNENSVLQNKEAFKRNDPLLFLLLGKFF